MAKGCRTPRSRRQLFVAETTVKTHVGRVLHKLRLRDRAQAVVLAYESGLVRPGALTAPGVSSWGGGPEPFPGPTAPPPPSLAWTVRTT